MHVSVIIVAGGRGVRMGAATPKQLLPLGGIPIIQRTLAPFVRCGLIQEVIVASSADAIDPIREIADSLHSPIPVRIVPGGTDRQGSVWNALTTLSAETDIVLIHDAVRPFITGSLIGQCIEGAREHGAVTAVRPIHETVKEVRDGIVTSSPDRDALRITLTPQAFRRDIIVRAHERAMEDGFTGTDDCMLVERMGEPVHVIEGDDFNIKITTPADLAIAGAILNLFEHGANEC